MSDREIVLQRAVKMMVELIGDDDLPENGNMSGAAICEYVRTVADAVEKNDTKTIRMFARFSAETGNPD